MHAEHFWTLSIYVCLWLCPAYRVLKNAEGPRIAEPDVVSKAFSERFPPNVSAEPAPLPEWIHYEPNPLTRFWDGWYAFEKNWSQQEKFEFETELGIALAESKRVQNITEVLRYKVGKFLTKAAKNRELQDLIVGTNVTALPTWQETREKLVADTFGHPGCHQKGIVGIVLPHHMGDIWFPERIEKPATLREVFGSFYCVTKIDPSTEVFQSIMEAVAKKQSLQKDLETVLDTLFLRQLMDTFKTHRYAKKFPHIFSDNFPDFATLRMHHYDMNRLTFPVPNRIFSYRLDERLLHGVEHSAEAAIAGAAKRFFYRTVTEVKSLRMSPRETEAFARLEHIPQDSVTEQVWAGGHNSGCYHFCLDLGTEMECGGAGSNVVTTKLQPPKTPSGNILSEMTIETKFRMYAGVSGTGLSCLLIGKLVKFTKSELVDLRLACMAWMLVALDHSFMEIMTVVEHFMPKDEKVKAVLARAAANDLAHASTSSRVKIMLRALGF